MVVGNNVGTGNIVNSHAAFNLYPNPNTGIFTLKGIMEAGNTAPVHISITDMMGRNIYTATATPTNGTIELPIELGSELASGVYILHLQAAEYSQKMHFSIQK